MERWYSYFSENRARRTHLLFHRQQVWEKITLSEPVRSALTDSLARFEVGESGEGKRLKAGAATTGSKIYCDTIALFLDEEHDHAAWLGRLIDALDGKHLSHHWSDVVFVALRHIGGLQTELMILLIAEMIAQKYYQALRDRIEHPLCRAVFAQICEDEDGHVAFHTTFLQTRLARQSGIERVTTRWIWFALFRLACLVVAWDHRAVFHACGVSFREFWQDTELIFWSTAHRVFTNNTIHVIAPESLS